MARINPETLKALRGKLSLKDLEKKSRVNAQSIHRIEKGGKKQNRQIVIESLAEALGVTAEDLTKPVSDVPSAASREAQNKITESQVNLRVSDKCRNSLALTGLRYGVTQSQIVEIAPYLFCWAAEESLRRRQERLDAIAKNDEERAALAAPHLHGRAFNNYMADDTLAAEQRSIAANDIFGTKIVGDKYDSFLPEFYEEEYENPFSKFLKSLAQSIGGDADFECWCPDGSPEFEICRSEASKFVAGDEEATWAILTGYVPLYELPSELKKKGDAKARAKWVREQAAENPVLKILSEHELSELEL